MDVFLSALVECWMLVDSFHILHFVTRHAEMVIFLSIFNIMGGFQLSTLFFNICQKMRETNASAERITATIPPTEGDHLGNVAILSEIEAMV